MSHQGDDFANYMLGSSFDDTIEGFGGNDMIFGRGGRDLIYGDDGNDTMAGEAGDDDIFGGSGLDWALFAGPIGNYSFGTFGTFPENISVTDLVFTDGEEWLTSVERVQFSNLGVAFDLYGNAGAAARLAGVLFDGPVVDDPTYMRAFIEAFDYYDDLDIAGYVIDTFYPSYDAIDLAALIVDNLVGSAGSIADIYEVASLILTYGDAEVAVAASYTTYNDFNINFAGLVANGVEFLPFG